MADVNDPLYIDATPPETIVEMLGERCPARRRVSISTELGVVTEEYGGSPVNAVGPNHRDNAVRIRRDDSAQLRLRSTLTREAGTSLRAVPRESEVDTGKKTTVNVKKTILALGLHPIPELMALRKNLDHKALCLTLHGSVGETILFQVARYGLLAQRLPKLFDAEVTVIESMNRNAAQIL